MAITDDDLERVRSEFELKMAAVTVDQMKAATAIGAYAERFNGVEARFDAFEMRLDSLSGEIDRRFAEVDRRFEQVDRRLGGIDRRLDRLEDRVQALDSKIDNRFGWQTVMMSVLGALILFGDPIRATLGL